MPTVTLNEPKPAPSPAAVAPAGDIVTDAKGRRLKLRELSLLEEQDLLLAMGAEAADNRHILGRAMAVARVAAIDGDPIAVPRTTMQYRAMLQQVGHDGLAAVLKAIAPPPDGEDGGAAEIEAAKN